jgi:integrase
LAKNKWYVEFYFYDDYHEKMIRIRLSKQLNRLKEYDRKFQAFRELQTICNNDLRSGWNPIERKHEIKTNKAILLDEAIQKFICYHKGKGTRRTSIDAYTSKLKLFREHMGNGRVDKIDDYDITNFLDSMEIERNWTGVTYNYAKIVLNNLFIYLKKYRFVSQNPTDGLERRKEVKTETHQVFTDSDFVLIMKWLRANDPFCLLFVQSLYYTCIRPRELRYTQLRYINLSTDVITIPAIISKNKKPLPVKIDPTFKIELLKLDIDTYPDSYHLFGDTTKIIGRNRVGENTPYNRFQKCLQELNLTNKNYTLYSFKHLSNVRKYLAGWTIAEICAANRHSSLVETETYLKDLIKFIPVTKPVPII